MTKNILTVCLIAVSCITLTACAQQKKSTTSTTKKSKLVKEQEYPKPILIQATKQKTLGGREETPPITEYRFLIVWQSSEEPAGFFWRGQQSWEPCNISKTKNYVPLKIKGDSNPYYINYESVSGANKTYAKGDTLELYPVAGGKYPIPAEVDESKNNIIYYKTANTKWTALAVDSIIKLPTIAMP